MTVLTDLMYQYCLRAGENLGPPVMNNPVVNGTAGTTQYSYAATFVSIVGETNGSAPVVVSTGAAQLNGVNSIQLNVASIPAGVVGINYYKLNGSTWQLLGSATPTQSYFTDIGQALATTTMPAVDTSGRPSWLANLWNCGPVVQRPELMDSQWMLMRAIKRIGDTIYKNGDVISGIGQTNVSGNTWQLGAGEIYLEGLCVNVPQGNVALQGVGSEVVGLMITPQVVTATQDLYARNLDQLSPDYPAGQVSNLQYASAGSDKLVLNFEWVVGQTGMLPMFTFQDGQPLVQTIPTVTSELQNQLNRRTYDVSGDFVVRNFPMAMQDDPNDPTQMQLQIQAGKAYVGGDEIATIAPQFVEIPRARDVNPQANSVLDPFDIPGGMTVGTVAGPFNVDGLVVSLQIGSGNVHNVTLTGTSQTAAQVATQIAGSVNAYPTAGTGLIACQDPGSGHLEIQAPDGTSLNLLAVANSAYTVLGLTIGAYTPGGQRIYQVNSSFVKDVTNMNYLTETVEAVVHNGATHIDNLANTGVQSILGAATTQADCHDGKWSYQLGVDFVKNGNRIDFSQLGGAKPPTGTTYYVKYHYNYTAVQGVRVRVRVTDAQVVKGAQGAADTITFNGNTSAVQVQAGTTVTGLSGSATDVIDILQVNNSPGQSVGQYSAYAFEKNAGALNFSPSQISWASAGTPGTTGAGQPLTGATYYVTFEYWQHTTEGDYLAANSFLNDYPEIEMAPNGTWNLRDCCDFRPTGGKYPLSQDSAIFNYEYYQPRCDMLVLGSDAYFERVAGAPADNPVKPTAPSGALQIALITVPPYTYNSSDCVIQSMQPLRISQQGIQELSAQIQVLQYYQAQNASQQAAVSNPAATDAKGIFVDPVTGQSGGDYQFNVNGIFFNAAIDQANQCVRLPAVANGQPLLLDGANSTGMQETGGVLMFEYQPWTYQTQPLATRVININPDMYYGWTGTVTLNPSTDYFTDVNQLPTVDLNYNNEQAALTEISAENAQLANQITWSSWNLVWDQSGGYAAAQLQEAPGASVHWEDQSTGSTAWVATGQGFQLTNGERQRSGTQQSIVPNRTLVDLGDTVLDMTVVPYCRTTYADGSPFLIQLSVSGLMPLIDVAGTIAGTPVNLTPLGTTQAGVSQYQGESTVKTDGSGACTCEFQMPSGIQVGQIPVQIFSAANPSESYAISQFISQGFAETVQDQVMGTITTTEVSTAVTQTMWHYGDPLAQSFMVDTNDGTVWISAVNLRFQAKDTILPVTVQIRGMTNGTPNTTVYQTCTLNPSQVNISNDASAVTTFTFANPVGYGPGEYSVELITNCATYLVWEARMGDTDVPTGTLVTQQPAGGVMYTSPNGSYWQGWPNDDLTFDLVAANFQNNCQLVFSAINGIQAGMICAAVTQVLEQGVTLQWSYSINGTSWVPFAVEINTDLNSIATSIQVRCDVTGSGGTFQISPGPGIILILNQPSADAIYPVQEFASPCTSVTMVVNLATDGVNGAGVRSVIPYFTIDEGKHWVELYLPAGYVPTAIGDGTYQEWQFKTPGEATVTSATNATPIVITSLNHGFQEGSVVTVTGCLGNTAANGTWQATNVTATTLQLYDPSTETPIAGNGNYTGGGTFSLAEFTQCRFRIHLSTSNQAVSPMAQEIRGICS